jgi:Ca-activated chloride channel family protein
MIDAAGLGLLRPWFLLALPLVIVLAAIAARRVSALGGWTRVVEPGLLDAMARRGGVVAGRGRRNMVLAALGLLLAVALVGPALERPATESFRNLDGTVVVFDLSKSVTQAKGFEAARAATQEALASSGTRQAALVVFAGEPFIGSPFTSDHAALSRTIFGLDGGTVPVPGSRPALALDLALDMLRGAGVVAGDILLVSDGGTFGEETRASATRIADAGFRIDTLYTQSAIGRDGNPGELAALAALSGGVSGEASDALAVAAALADDAAKRIGASDFRALAWVDLGPFLLLAALVPALMLFRRTA